MRKTNELRNIDFYRFPKAGQDPQVYADCLLDLASDANIWDRGKGRISWIQGKLLNLARESCRKRGSWGIFLRSIRMHPSTAKHLRRIARETTEDESRKKGYSEMLADIYPSFKKTLKEDAEKDDAPPRRTKGKGNNAPAIACPIVQTSQSLTVASKALQGLADSLPDRKPDKAGAPNVGNLKRLATQVRNDAERVVNVLTGWQSQLQVAA